LQDREEHNGATAPVGSRTGGRPATAPVGSIASAAFAFYVANFASYNKTYGTTAGVIVFLLWLWVTNLAVLLGLGFDAETVRQRAIAGGHPAEAEPYTQPRDTRKWDEGDRRRLDET
jgi:membrane protein